MSRTSSEVKYRWNKKAYDAIPLTVPKGRKADIAAYASAHGESVNGLINRLIQTELGLSTDEWKRPASDPDDIIPDA